MNEEATQGDEERPVVAVKNATITQILGRVKAAGVKLSADDRPAANNTRWVFDVVIDGNETLVVELLEHRSGRVLSPDLMSYSWTAASPGTYEAKPVLYEEDGGLVIKTQRGTSAMRVSVDVMHSATR